MIKEAKRRERLEKSRWRSETQSVRTCAIGVLKRMFKNSYRFRCVVQYSSSRASSCSEGDLPGESNTRLEHDPRPFHPREFWSRNGPTAISGTCQFSMLAPVTAISGLQSTVPRQPSRLSSQQSRRRLVLLKLSFQRLQSAGPRQFSNGQVSTTCC